MTTKTSRGQHIDRIETIIVTLEAGIILIKPHGVWEHAPEISQRAFVRLMASLGLPGALKDT